MGSMFFQEQNKLSVNNIKFLVNYNNLGPREFSSFFLPAHSTSVVWDNSGLKLVSLVGTALITLG